MEYDEYRLRNGVSCRIAASMGCNLFAWVVDGREVFYVAPGFGQDPLKFFYGGNPVLFPAVGRTWDRTGSTPRFGIYRIHGHDAEYFMPLHGLLQSAECQRTAELVGKDQVRVESSVRLPGSVRQKSYPFDVSLALAYTLEHRSLCLDAAITNHSSDAAPFSFGYHPWFATADPERRGVEALLPCTHMRTIDPHLSVPDGGRRALSGPLRFDATTSYDGVYAGLTGTRATLRDHVGGRQIHVDVDANIADFVVASPKTIPAVCIEPWAAGLGAYETLGAAHWQTASALPMVPPGATRTVQVRYTVEEIPATANKRNLASHAYDRPSTSRRHRPQPASAWDVPG